MNYIDLHADTIYAMKKNHFTNLKNCNCQINLDKLIESNCMLQCFAMFIHLGKTSRPLEACLELIDCYYQELDKNKDVVAPVFLYSDFLKNQKNHQLSSLLTIEEGEATLGNISHLRNFYRLGVRMMTLTWNFENSLGYPHSESTMGLKESGKEIIKEMNRLGMIIDVSHLSDQGFYDVLDISTKPVVASHSNARSVCNHSRNLTDDMILKLSKNGGVMGINFYPFFLDKEDGEKTLKYTIKHMLYVKKLAGVDVLALGTDYDGMDEEIELKDASFMQRLFKGMRDAGFTEEEIKKIAYQNFLRVLEANLV